MHRHDSRRPGAGARPPRLGDAFLITLGSICVLFLAYAAARHRSYFVGLPRIVAYYGLPAFLAAAVFLALRLPAERRARLALAAATSIVCLAILELGAAWYWGHTTERAARRRGSTIDRRSKLELLSDLNAAGIRAVPCMLPMELVRRDLAENAGRSGTRGDPLPLGGIARRPTVLCNEVGTYVVYDSDEHGFNNPPGLWQGPIEVAAVGDSFAHGACVPVEDGLVARIRERRGRTLNVAMSGSGPLLELATLREFLPALGPRVVLWFYYAGNDLSLDLELEKRHPLLRRYLEEPDFRQDLRSRQSEVDAQLERAVAAAMQAEALEPRESLGERWVRFVRLEHLRLSLGLAFGRGDRDLALFERVLAEARRSVGTWGGELVFVYLPGWTSFRRLGLERQDESRAEVLALVNRLGLALVDIEPVFARDPQPILRYFTGAGHYNEEGYRAVAREVLERIDARPIAPGDPS